MQAIQAYEAHLLIANKVLLYRRQVFNFLSVSTGVKCLGNSNLSF